MDAATRVVELRMSYRYAARHAWVVQAMTGFLSAYFMEEPGFRVQRHFQDLETGMPVWRCEVPEGSTMSRLLRRLKADVPAFRYTEVPDAATGAQYIIDTADPPRAG